MTAFKQNLRYCKQCKNTLSRDYDPENPYCDKHTRSTEPTLEERIEALEQEIVRLKEIIATK